MIPHDIIDMLESTWRALSTMGLTFGETQWKTPTAMPGWSVQDTYSHIIGTERHLEGLPATTHRAAPAPYVHNPIGEMNEHEVDARRALTGAQVLAEFDDLTAQRVRTLRAGDDAYFATEMATPTGPNTLAYFLGMRLMDCWMHDQDIRRALAMPMTLADPAAAHTVDWMLQFAPMVVGKRAHAPEDASVRLRLHAPVERDLTYRVTNGRAALDEHPDGEASATVAMDTETYLLLAMGRVRSNEVRYDLAGDRALGQAVVDGLCTMI